MTKTGDRLLRNRDFKRFADQFLKDAAPKIRDSAYCITVDAGQRRHLQLLSRALNIVTLIFRFWR